MEQQILVENETHLDVHITEQPLVSITEPIQTEVVALSVEQDVKVIQEESAVLLVLTEGGSLYKNAVNNGFSGTELEWMTELLDSKASVQFVVTTMADGNTAYASALLALKAEVGSTYATNVHLSEVIAQRDLARALDKQILESKIDNDIFASNQAMLETMVTADQALSQSLNLLSTNLGSFGSRVSTVEQSITNETSARTLAMQSMSSSFNNRIDAELVTINQTFVDATGSYATQVQNINTSFNNLLNASINTVNQAITTETQARASQIETLRVDFTSGLSAVIFTIQQVQIDIDGNTTAIDLVTGQVNNPTTGLNAAFTRANQAYTLADNTAGAFSIIEGKVNHPTTGLAATYAFAQQVEINANNNTASSINSLRNEITAPNAGWTANNTFIQSIRNDLNNNISTTTTLNSTVVDLNTWKTSTASVQLSSLITTTGQLESRAFLGVTSVSGGKAVVTGLTINSVNNGIIMRGDVFGLENVAGTPVLYWSDSDNTLNIKARLVLSGGETITSVNDIKAYDAIVAVLEKEGRILSADSAGTVSSYVGSSNIISVYQGTTELQYETGTGNPTTNGRFRVVVSASNITAGAISASGLKASMANTSAMTADNATITYTINIRNNAGVVSSIIKTYSLAKSRQGVAGTGGIDGTIGAGFYGSTYSAIDWTTATANSRFTTLVGRSPVQYDIFIQTRIDGTDSQARQYNGSSWVTVALQVNGSIIASGTIAGDKIIAGTSISAPVINTPTIKGGNIQLIGSNYMKIQSATPFGPHNLVEWRGPKVAGVTWNNATQSPIYTNITKSNAIEYADDNGNVYFGGTITAGTLRNALQTTLVTANPVIETGYFSSNGNVITILVSFDSSIGENNVTGGTCPVQGQPNGVLYLDKWNGSTWVQVAMQPIYGMYECNVEPGGYVASWFLSGSFTYYDTTGTTENRRYRARGTLNGMPLLAGTFSSLSILTEE